MGAADRARGDAPSESECVDCPARATVGIMIKGVARQLGQIGAGDGRPPAALWAAMCAEDWQGIQREWDRWMRPQLTRLADSRRDWKWAADSVIEHTRDVLDEALPPDAAVLKVMRCTAAWLTGKDELPPPVAARWEEREWGRAWHEWDASLWGELNRVPPERLWPEVTKPCDMRLRTGWIGGG